MPGMVIPRLRQTGIRILVAGALGSSLVVTAAVANTMGTTGHGKYGEPAGCPPSFEAEDARGKLEKYDRNDDGIVCVKEVPGRGNVGDGRVATDNNK
jgi:hypothetical protein